jgi:hypothetical protein
MAIKASIAGREERGVVVIISIDKNHGMTVALDDGAAQRGATNGGFDGVECVIAAVAQLLSVSRNRRVAPMPASSACQPTSPQDTTWISLPAT